MKYFVVFFKSISRYFKSSIVGKMIIGYIVIIFIPVTVLGIIIYNRCYDNIVNENQYSQQSLIEQSYSNINGKFKQIEGIYQIFQTNTQMEDWLSGLYESDAERVYVYNKYISTLLNYVIRSNDSINNIVIYKYNDKINGIEGVINNVDKLTGLNKIEENLKNARGSWLYQNNQNPGPTLKYYRDLYNSSYSKVLGIIEIDINPDIITNYLKNTFQQRDVGIYLFSTKNQLIYGSSLNYDLTNIINNKKESILGKLKVNNYFSIENKGKIIIVNSLYIKDINMKTVILSPLNPELNKIKKTKYYVLIIALILLLILSSIYYFITYNITERITKLAKHMKSSDNKNKLFFEEDSKKDEIGFLVDSYNSMIKRNDELLNKVYKAEILRKEATYSALYAQVRPHFIYNILETIRMLAETKNDYEVADISYKFAKLIRYSITNKKEVTLKNEIDNIILFLDIHKVRFGSRLEYNIEISGEIESFKCPWFLLQPIVENSIIHGIAEVRKQGYIEIKAAEKDEYMVITVLDNGIGITGEKLKLINEQLSSLSLENMMQNNSIGIGITNVHRRILGYYGNESYMTINSSQDGGTIVEMYLRKQGLKDEIKDTIS